MRCLFGGACQRLLSAHYCACCLALAGETRLASEVGRGGDDEAAGDKRDSDGGGGGLLCC